MNASRRARRPALPTSVRALNVTCTTAELDMLEQQAAVNNDRFTLAEVRGARKGDQAAMIACAMSFGR